MKKSEKKQKKSLKNKSKLPKKDQISGISDVMRQAVVDDTEKFLSILGMNDYRYKIFYKKDEPDTDETGIHASNVVAASATVDVRYLTVYLYIYPHMINSWNNGNLKRNDLRDIIAHEISHVATCNLWRIATSVFKDEGEAKDAWESLTERFGRLMVEIDELRKDLTNANKGCKLKK